MTSRPNGAGGQIFCDDSTKASVLHSVTMGLKHFVTSFVDDPLGVLMFCQILGIFKTGHLSHFTKDSKN